MNQDEWEQMSPKEKKKQLFLKQKNLLDTFLGDMVGGEGGINGFLQVITGRRGTDLQRGHIFLRVILQLVNQFGLTPRTNDHYPCSQGI